MCVTYGSERSLLNLELADSVRKKNYIWQPNTLSQLIMMSGATSLLLSTGSKGMPVRGKFDPLSRQWKWGPTAVCQQPKLDTVKVMVIV